MILDKYIKVKISDENFYLTKRLDNKHKIGEEVTIPIDRLEMSDRVKINVKCDICDKVQNIMFRNYNLNLRSNGDKYCCCVKSQKIKETCLKKYGVENVSNIKSVVDKRKQTSMKNWGCENHMKNEEFLKKYKIKNLEKYGYETPFNSKEILQKCSKTVQDKYNVDNVFQNENVKSKIKKQT